MATTSTPHPPDDVRPTSPTTPAALNAANNGPPPPLARNSLLSPAGDSSATTSSHQRRAEALGSAAVRATSSAGNSISSRSHGSVSGCNGNHSANVSNGIADMIEGTIRDPLLPDSASRHIRTLPTWVQRREEDEEEVLRVPPPIHRRPPHSVHNEQREEAPITPSSPIVQESRWKGFVARTAYPPNTAHSEKAGDSWLAEQPDLNAPWLARDSRDPENEGASSGDDPMEIFGKKKRRIWYKRIHIMLLNSPMVPLFFRSIIWTLSLIALALAGSIYRLSWSFGVQQKASTIMAIVVDALALVYLIYITYDEYSGKPLGLRSPKMKIRLIMFDLIFIVFDSANLSLAFDSLFDVRWSCRAMDMAEGSGGPITPVIDPICNRQRALAAFLFLALCAWIATFTVSVFRVVERVSSAR